MIEDPPAFEEDQIEGKIHEIIEKLGVKVLTNLKLIMFDTDHDNSLKSVKFQKYGENGEPIEKKVKVVEENEEEEGEVETDREKLDGEYGLEDGEEQEDDDEDSEEEESNELELKVRLL